MENILIVKTSALGDIVHVYPVIDYLRSLFPKARIDWVAEAPCIDLVKSHPAVTRAIAIETKKWRKAPFQKGTWQAIGEFRKQLREVDYDIVFDLQGNIKSGLVVAQVRSRIKVGFGLSTVPEKPNLFFTNKRINPLSGGNIRKDYLGLVASYFNDEVPLVGGNTLLRIGQEQQQVLKTLMTSPVLQKGKVVMVCAGSAWQNKQMTPEALGNFLRMVQGDLDARFLFAWGTPGEKLIAEDLQKKFSEKSIVIEKMSLAMLQNLMGMCDLVIAMDSLPLHLAGTTKTPSFSVFGASSAKKYKPLGEQHGAFQGSCPYGRTFEKRCPVLRTCPTGACIRGLDGSETFSFFKSWWAGISK